MYLQSELKIKQAQTRGFDGPEQHDEVVRVEVVQCLTTSLRLGGSVVHCHAFRIKERDSF